MSTIEPICQREDNISYSGNDGSSTPKEDEEQDTSTSSNCPTADISQVQFSEQKNQ